MPQHDLTLVEELSLPFLLSVPETEGPGTEQARRWPVLCFLHGLGEGPPTDIYAALTAHGPLRAGSSSLATSEFIVAAPQLPARGDIWHSHAAMVCEMVEYLQSGYATDPGRVYLTGFSFGANGVFDVARFHRSLWAALWPVDPTRVPDSDPGLPVWLSAGQASRPSGAGFLERLKLRSPGSLPDERVYQDEGLDHVATATSAYRSDRVYNWLLSKHV